VKCGTNLTNENDYVVDTGVVTTYV